MAVAKEAIETILNYCPKERTVCHEKKDLGSIGGTPFRAIFGIFSYQMRVTALPDEQLILSWTKQPVVALSETIQCEERLTTRYKPLPYASEIRALPEGLAEKLASHLENLKSLTRRIYGEWEV